MKRRSEPELPPWSRRQFMQSAGLVAGAAWLAPAYARSDAASVAVRPEATVPSADDPAIDLNIDAFSLNVDGRSGKAIAVNGSIPGPLIRLREGQDAVFRVHNRLNDACSIHWHGVLVPPEMDGVPGVSFAGIPPHQTFTYRFPVRQSGTYWAHSHSGAHELLGMYFPLIIDPIAPEPFHCDRDYAAVLSDWSFLSPVTIIQKLKKQDGYFNFQKRTTGDFIQDASHDGFLPTARERLRWARMRMDATDFADVTGHTYTYLFNGLTPSANWTGVFQPGERVRLRFIAAGAMTYFDVRIPGLKMTVVQADGQYVKPVLVDEFRIAPGETYDVLVEPENRAYTVFAESMDRSGYARGTLAPHPGMAADIPERRRRPVRSMADMGMSMSGAKSMPEMEHMHSADASSAGSGQMSGMQMGRPAQGRLQGPSLPGSPAVMHGPDTHGAGNSMVAKMERNRLNDPGDGFEGSERKVLVYADLHSPLPQKDRRDATREIELHLTGNMDRYMWSFDGKKYSDAMAPIPFSYGERLRLILVNDTMMEHPLHLHGMWMELERRRP